MSQTSQNNEILHAISNLSTEIGELRTEMNIRFSTVNSRFDTVENRLDTLELDLKEAFTEAFNAHDRIDESIREHERMRHTRGITA